MKQHLDNDDLRKVRDHVSWRAVFDALGIRKDERRSRQEDWWGHSPFNPDEHTASFHMNDEGWYCHSTAQGGGPIELVQRVLGCNCYEAGRWLLDRGLSDLRSDTRAGARRTAAASAVAETADAPVERSEEAKHNPAIRQDLRPQLVRDHPAFSERGITPETLEELGAGYYAGGPRSRSPLKGRLVFQIRGVQVDGEGATAPVILSHIGRAATEEQERTSGKWLFYSGFHSSLELYNQDMLVLDPEAQRQGRETGRVLLVEGCFDVAKLWSAGIRNTVASFGAHLCDEQVARLRWISERLGTNRVVVFFDRDQDGSEPNRRGAERSLEVLRQARFDAELFEWAMEFRDRRRGTVRIASTITDPCELTVEQLRWLRSKGLL